MLESPTKVQLLQYTCQVAEIPSIQGGGYGVLVLGIQKRLCKMDEDGVLGRASMDVQQPSGRSYLPIGFPYQNTVKPKFGGGETTQSGHMMEISLGKSEIFVKSQSGRTGCPPCQRVSHLESRHQHAQSALKCRYHKP